MKTNKYPDGSISYEFEIGDRVIVERTIHGGWFDKGPCNAEYCTVHSIDKHGVLEIRFSNEWGTVSCHSWHLKPYKPVAL